MKLEKPLLKNLLFALVLLCISSCNNNTKNIPFPENETDFPQPVSKPLKFSDVKKLNWSNVDSPIKPLIKNLDFNKLPVKIYDSSGFIPFVQNPDSMKFDYDKLANSVFNYDNLPSIPLKFETSVLDSPEVIHAGPPRLIKGATNLMYELEKSQGLEGNLISCIFEDKTGFLWIATDKGLYRYDGEDLVLYIRIKDDYFVFSILEDTQGQIWMTSSKIEGDQNPRTDLIDPKSGVVKRLITSKGYGDGGIYRMSLDDKGRIWTASYLGGVNIIDQNSGLIKRFDKAHGLSDNTAYTVIQDNGTNIWISTLRGVDIVDLKKGKIKYLDRSTGLNADTIYSMKQDNMNRVWTAGLHGKLSSIDLERGAVVNYDHVFGKNSSLLFALALLDDNRGDIWIGGYTLPDKAASKVVIIDPASKLIKTIKTSDGLTAFTIEKILQDKRGQIWIATFDGLKMVYRNGNNIQHIGKSDITGLAEDARGRIWVGNFGAGIDILDPSTGSSQALTKAQGLSGSMYSLIAKDGKVFIESNAGLDIIDSSHKTIEHIGKPQGLSTDSVNDIIDNRGMLWVTGVSGTGIDIIDLQKNTIRHVSTDHGLNDASIVAMTQDHQGRIWFMSLSGGGIIDTKTSTIKYLNNLPGLKDQDYPYLKSFLEDKQGNMWIGTFQGIYIINETTDSFIVFSTREGLLNNSIRSLNRYNDQIYVGTFNGLNIITLPNAEYKYWKVRSYTEAQGFSNLANESNSDLITKNGKFIEGDLGLTIFNNAIDTIIPKTYISGIDIFNRAQYFPNNPWSYISKEDTLWSLAKDSFYLEGKLPSYHSLVNQDKMKWDSITGPCNMPVNLRLNHDENYLQFHFSQVNLGSIDQTFYKYILEGIDKNWSNKTAKAYSENYPNLPPGEYIFKVCSEGFNDLWSTPAELKFTILPPFWQTWWSYIAEVIAAIAMLFWIIRFYISRTLARQRIEFEKLKAVSAERERIASDMHDDLGAGLTSIRLLSEVANIKTLKESAAKSEIEKIVKSAHSLSENLREIIWTMNTKYDKLEDFIIYIRGYSVEFFDTSSIKFQFNKPAIVPGITIPGELRRNIFLCIKEALNNIVKHSGATEAELSFDIANNVLVTQIKDNGKGIDASQINKYGNGLNGMRERLNKYGSNLSIEANNGTSLRFEIDIQK